MKTMSTGCLSETDFGWLALYGTDGVVYGMSIGFQTDEAALAWLDQHGIDELDPEEWAEVVEAVRSYLAGETYSLGGVNALEPVRLTGFQRRVRQVVSAIPYGETRTYGEVAELAGRPRAARAVGTVMASNHVPLLMPCHRVVPAGGKLGGFTGPGGVVLKQKLLDLERVRASTAREPRTAR